MAGPHTERVAHRGLVPQSAWNTDAAACMQGRVEISNASRAGGLDMWTMDEQHYELMRKHILGMLDDEADDDGTILLKDVVATAQDATALMGCSRRAASRTTSATPRPTSRRGARSDVSSARGHGAFVAGEATPGEASPLRHSPRSSWTRSFLCDGRFQSGENPAVHTLRQDAAHSRRHFRASHSAAGTSDPTRPRGSHRRRGGVGTRRDRHPRMQTRRRRSSTRTFAASWVCCAFFAHLR